MQRRTRNRICLWFIMGGLINFLVYTFVYAELGGDAKNGGYGTYTIDETTGETATGYYITGHFIKSTGGRDRGVSKAIWIYSYLHSISLWPTQGAMVICMMILARPHIIATMRENAWMDGSTFITIIMTITALLCIAMTCWFAIHFVREVAH